MSSTRRTSGEIHILAMLDGKSTTSLSRRFLALPAMAWYAAAGATVCLVLATLAWLVHTPTAHERDAATGIVTVRLPAAAGSAVTLATAVDEAANNPALVVTEVANLPEPGIALPSDAPAMPRAPAPVAPRGATIVDATGPALPHAAPDHPALAAGTAPLSAPPTLSAKGQGAATATPPRHELPAAHAQASHDANADAHADVRSVASKTTTLHPATPRPSAPGQATAAMRPGTAAPKPRRQANPSRTAVPAAVDTDVALISAIIQHTAQQQNPTQAATRGDTASGTGTGTGTATAAAVPTDAHSDCPDRTCGPRMPNRQ